ncbi:MAG: SpoIIE family protein phosphatase [Gammaproteobacteria bacterium]|nr:MAG: SpoIIE family protein phosphatase [Gammaproteobacteria bacterium]
MSTITTSQSDDHPSTRPTHDIAEVERANRNPTRSVLVVEDDAAERVRLSAILEKMQFDVVCAGEGQEAVGLLEAGYRPGIIISDWSMPGMDGVELCQWVRRLANSDNFYFILVTGRDGSSVVEDGLNAGADDFIAKPYRGAELRARVEAGRRVVGQRAHLQESNSQLRQFLAVKKASEQRLTSGLEAAAKLQRRQLPPRLSVVEGVECGRIFHSADALAGDVFGCVRLCGNRVAFYLLDVVGHGFSAALNSFAIGRIFSSNNSLAELCMDDGLPCAPSKVIRRLNTQFLGDEECDQYFTMIYGTLDTRTGSGSICQAGHPHPMVLGRDGGVRLLGTGGYPVGLLEEADYEDSDFSLEPGDRLTLFSDGIIESSGLDGEMFGYDRLSKLLSSIQDMPLGSALDSIEADLNEWQNGKDLDDDVSLMVIARTGVEEGS